MERLKDENIRLRNMLHRILMDGTGDANNLAKRVWPIRSAYYREAKALLAATIG